MSRTPPGTVAVAMSGGVDSSVAALLLSRQGWNVVGITMKLRHGSAGPVPEEDRSCCTLDTAMDARRVCESIGVPHYTLDMVSDFEHSVIGPFYQSYREGRTPNPCVDCNSFLKWGALWDKARLIGADCIATGHYATTLLGPDGVRRIARARDPLKDQSYFLWGIQAKALEQTLFPLEELAKVDTRRIAEEAGLRVAHKPESQDICFIPHGDKDRFLRERAAEQGDSFGPGNIVDLQGRILGQHEGLAFYTIGQRRGVAVAGGERLFVVERRFASNELVLGPRSMAESTELRVQDFHWFGEVPASVECLVQIRYRGGTVPCTVTPSGDGNAKVMLHLPLFAVAAGQSAVFYDGDVVLGGGRITH